MDVPIMSRWQRMLVFFLRPRRFRDGDMIVTMKVWPFRWPRRMAGQWYVVDIQGVYFVE